MSDETFFAILIVFCMGAYALQRADDNVKSGGLLSLFLPRKKDRK